MSRIFVVVDAVLAAFAVVETQDHHMLPAGSGEAVERKRAG